MSLAKITLIGMYDYDATLFDNMQIPETLDKQTLIGNILLRGGEFETLYASVPFMKQAIGIWSSKWEDTFERWAETVALEYNPIENYDRMEEWDDDNTGDQTTVRSGDQTNVKSGNETFGKAGSEITEKLGTETSEKLGTEKNVKSGTETHVGSGNETNAIAGSETDQAGGGTTNLNEVSAFDAGNTLTTHDKQTFGTTQSNTKTFTDRVDTHTLNNLQDKLTYGDVTDTQSFTDRKDQLSFEDRKDQLSFTDRVDTTTYNNVQDKTTFNNVQDKRTDNLNLHHEGRVHGNIGVTTSQQMMESEMNLRLKWNLYNQITDLFLTEFVIPVY